MSEVEDTFKRILAHRGVTGVLIMNCEGIAIRSSLDQPQTTCYAALMQQVVAKVNSSVKELDPTNSTTFIRLRTHKHEIMIAPDKEYYLLVIQTPDVC